jgi:hypothetical protein
MTKKTTDAAAAEATKLFEAEKTAAERRIAELEYEKLVRDCAVRGGVLPQGTRFSAESPRLESRARGPPALAPCRASP